MQIAFYVTFKVKGVGDFREPPSPEFPAVVDGGNPEFFHRDAFSFIVSGSIITCYFIKKSSRSQGGVYLLSRYL